MKKQFENYKKYLNKVTTQKNEIDTTFFNGVFSRYVNPIVTPDYIPVEWRFNLKDANFPYVERLGINATLNPGAIYFEDAFYLVVRTEGTDRKSFFSLARSENGIDNFKIIGEPLHWEDIDKDETNMYDMRLVKHEDGRIYGVYCSECKDSSKNDTSSAIAKIGFVVTDDLKTWTRLPNITFGAWQQRNAVLHPEFVNGRYAFYTRPQSGFIDVGAGGGIGFGYVDNIKEPAIVDEVIINPLRYHTVYELKNGEGPAPIKTEKGWIHFAHGVRNTAAGLRYVLYSYATSLEDPTKVIAQPSGHLLAPIGKERVGDVSNVLFTNGVVLKDNTVYLYYASSDTNCHVATANLDDLIEYVFNNPSEEFRTLDCVNQRLEIIRNNK